MSPTTTGTASMCSMYRNGTAVIIRKPYRAGRAVCCIAGMGLEHQWNGSGPDGHAPRGGAGPGHPGRAGLGQALAVTCLLVSLLVMAMVRGLAFSWMGMARVSTPAV